MTTTSLPIPSPLSPIDVLSRLDKIVQELPALNDPNQVKALADQAESIRYLTRKLGYDQAIQNQAAEAALWTKRRLGELLPPPQQRGGDRKSISTVDNETLSSVSRRIGIPQVVASRCVELAQIPQEEFQQHVCAVKENEGELSTAALFRHLVASRRGTHHPEAHRRTPALPDEVFEILYADPPWVYEFGVTSSRTIERHYATMTIEQICALPIPVITAPSAMLFLWATSPSLKHAFSVMEAWGFSYRSSMVWVKDGIGMGYYARINHEFLLIGRKGDYPAPEPSLRPSSVISAARGRHSEKPACVHEMLERMYPLARKVELFCRESRIGWTAWGNEARKTAPLSGALSDNSR